MTFSSKVLRPKKLQFVEMFSFHMTIHLTVDAYWDTMKIDVLIIK